MLRPHLLQAQEQAQAAAGVRARLQTLGRALEASDLAVILLASNARIELATRRARQWLREYFGSRRRPAERLPDDVSRWVAQQEEAVERADDMPPPRSPLRVARGDRTLTVRLLDEEGQRVLVLTEARATLDPAGLAALELTWRESEVLAWLACGKSNDEIATVLGTSPRTVAKHVEHIFRKLGVESRTAAAARAFGTWRAASPR